MASQLWWYVARSSGIVSWALLAASVLWGLALSTKATSARPAWLLDLHRYLGGLAVVFTATHVAAIVLDSYVHFGPTDVLVPLASAWHPVAVAWGIVAMYLVVAVEGTSLLRRRLTKRAWRLTHLLSFPLFVVATLHGLSAGTDSATPLMRYGLLGTTCAIFGLTFVRVQEATNARAALAHASVVVR
jgi:DMSO/TMAO reductase YedYZ heme-binding membrane subunit